MCVLLCCVCVVASLLVFVVLMCLCCVVCIDGFGLVAGVLFKVLLNGAC